MTERLYYTDSLLRSFDAAVVVSDLRDGRTEIVLDRTAFYPTSGGQPFDTGRLGDARVIDVREDDEGRIWHVVEVAAAPSAGTTLRGEIDWPRRLDHMQQHSGQHVLSAAFVKTSGVRTVSFHLGAHVSTIDLEREVSSQELARAETEANAVVWENRPVTVRFATEEEAKQLDVRRRPQSDGEPPAKRARSGEVRLVEVSDFDLSACGGTHVSATGMIGTIAIASAERFKGATRVTFVCGGRTLREYGQLRDVMGAASRALSVSVTELVPTIERLQGELKEANRSLRRLQEETAAARAAKMRDEAETIGRYRGVLKMLPDSDASALKALAAAIAGDSGMIAVLAGSGRPVPVVIARSAGVPVDAADLMKRAIAALGGRGGGRPELAQGGLAASADEVFSFLRSLIAETR